MNATTRWRGSAIAQRVVVAAIATALLLTGTAGPATSATPETFTATKSWTQSETVSVQEWATVGTFVGYGTATVTESATATRTYTAGAAWEADYWATWNAYLAASEEAKAKAEAKARPLAKAQATAQAQAQYDESLKGYDATDTWTQTETVKVDETYTIGDVVGHGTATATATATATGSAHAATQAEADWWATWNAYVAALLQARAQADAEARPIAKAQAKADAEAQVAAGVESTQSWTSTETVTVNETATVGDFVGHGTATSTKTVTATRTVKAATHWEAYYWAVIQASVDASAQATAEADAAARAEALAIAQADAQAQYDAAQVPVDPEEPGGEPTGPDCGTAPLKADGTPWTCTFVDEFRGTELDQTKWHPIDTYESEFSYGDCFFGDRNIEVSSGVLKLSTIREDQPVTCDHPAGAITTDYTSAAVTTFSKFSQAYGRYEIRAAMPQSDGPGLQSALWMLPEEPKYGEWPGSGEIDIVEFYSQYPDRLVPALHYNSLLPWGTRTNNNCLVYEPTAFHTYVLEWTPQKLTISIDGTTCLDHTISPLAPLIGSAPFDQPFNLNLTQMLGSGDNAFPEGQGIDKATLQVDYVRVWE